MVEWFYHDPGQGRVGPLSADDIRARWRERRLQRDTLVWRQGLPEWQPLERLADEFDLHTVQQDLSSPPPLPACAPAPVSARPSAYPAGRVAAPPPKRMSGCLIALIVLAVLAVPVIGILAAIAVPAYNDYLVRSKVSQAVDLRATAIKPALVEARSRLGRCPVSPEEIGLRDAPDVSVGHVDNGRCAFQITLRGVKPVVDGKTVVYVSSGESWDCTGGDLPPRYRSRACRVGTDTAP